VEIITKELYSFNLRIILINGVEWFVAKDIAELLLYKRPADAVAQHCKNSIDFEIGKIPNANFSKKARLIKLIPEPDVWRLIIKSRLPEAEKIEKWIFEEVLPSIRKTGSYSTKPKEDIDLDSIKKRAELLETSQKEFKIFEDVFDRIGITRKEELAITSNRAVAKETGVDFIELAELKGVSTPHKYFTVTELCQKVMSSDKFSEDFKKLVSTKKGDKPRPQNLNKLLETNGFQTKIDGIWKPTEKAKDLADFVQNKSKHSEKTVFHTVWKIEILEEIF
jgi:prophage antirepressor-like protein